MIQSITIKLLFFKVFCFGGIFIENNVLGMKVDTG